jgi:4-diphosphocytidyl-2-C-methyl-D-erythritol kinase
MRVARVRAQAKVNLMLRIGPEDGTGYHQLITLFQRIELADDVVVRLGGAGRTLDCAGPRLPAAGLGDPRDNLAWRAAEAYAARASWVRGFSIELTKNIPVGGGLGGGSADAGAVLRALEALTPTPLGSAALLEISAALGADVPFLAGEYALAIGSGRGDLVAGLEPLPEREMLLAIPDFGIPTGEAYRALDEEGGGTYAPPHADYEVVGMTDVDTWEDIAATSVNDFERVLELRFPRLRHLREAFDAAGAGIARLSGSGSTVFGVFDGTAPAPESLRLDAMIVPTRSSSRVVQVEVLE